MRFGSTPISELKVEKITRRAVVMRDGKGRRYVLYSSSRSRFLSGRDPSLVAYWSEGEGGTRFVYALASKEFTPLPHLILRDFVLGLLKEAGLDPKVVRLPFRRRVGYLFVLRRMELMGDVIEVGIAVSQRNDARSAIHIYTMARNTACGNLIYGGFLHSAAVHHRGRVEEVLGRVAERVRELLGILLQEAGRLRGRLEELTKIELSEAMIRNWLEAKLASMPEGRRRRLAWWVVEKLYRGRYAPEYGENAYALLQALTHALSHTRRRYIEEGAEKLVEALLQEGIGGE